MGKRPPRPCEECGRPVEQPRTTYRKYHPACKDLRNDVDRLRKHLEAIGEGIHKADLPPRILAELRYELFCMLTEIPRSRDEFGRFVSSGLSPTYDDAVAKRREARERAKEQSG